MSVFYPLGSSENNLEKLTKILIYERISGDK